jgi:rubrerythrin
MTDYTELVKALRYCSTTKGMVYCNVNCKYGWEERSKGCKDLLMTDAAAAIEDLQAELGKKRTADCFGCKCEKVEPKRGQYVHGRELSREYIGDCLVSIDYEDWRCSVCGKVFEQWSIPKYNYCPNCGAKMEPPKEGTHENRDYP